MRRLRRQHSITDQLRPRPALLPVSGVIRGGRPSRVKLRSTQTENSCSEFLQATDIDLGMILRSPIQGDWDAEKIVAVGAVLNCRRPRIRTPK